MKLSRKIFEVQQLVENEDYRILSYIFLVLVGHITIGV